MKQKVKKDKQFCWIKKISRRCNKSIKVRKIINL